MVLLQIGQFLQTNWLRVLEVVGTLVLTGALVYLYRQQKEILKLEHKPTIELADYDIQDTVTIYLSNYGNGLAHELELVSVIEFEATDTIEPATAAVPLRRRAGDTDMTRLERSIQPHSERIPFETDPGFAIQYATSEDKFRGDFSSVVIRLNEEGVETVRFQLYVRYTDELGTRGHERVLWPVREFTVESDLSFQEAYGQSGTFSAELLDVDLSERVSEPSRWTRLLQKFRR